jgi:hypothetical protein
MNQETIVQFVKDAHANSAAHGFWNHDKDCLEDQDKLGPDAGPCRCTNRDLDMKIVLIQSEISEALEELRKGETKNGGPFGSLLYQDTLIPSDARTLRDYPVCASCKHVLEDCGCDGLQNSIHNKLVGFMSELADVAIRIFDLIGYLNQSVSMANGYTFLGGARPQGTTLARLLRWTHNDVSHTLREPFSWRLGIALARVEQISTMVGGNLESAIKIKMAYNATRPMLHGGLF